jgi:hypothetical protein
VSSLHWLVLIPYYFFSALSFFLLFSVICRLVRAPVSANPMAITAILAGLVATAAPLLSGMTSLANYSWPGMLGLFAISMVLALADSLLKASLSLPADAELEDV